jgi:hypothetical protein
MSKEDLIDLFCGLASNQSIQKLKLENNYYGIYARIDDEMANIVANVLIQNATLKELEISYIHEMTHIGWQAIFTALQTNTNCRLEKLILKSHIIGEAAALSLSNVLLCHNTTLKTLDLSGIWDNMIAGWWAIFQPLQNPHCSLEKLNLVFRADSTSDESIAALANALSSNSRLKDS